MFSMNNILLLCAKHDHLQLFEVLKILNKEVSPLKEGFMSRDGTQGKKNGAYMFLSTLWGWEVLTSKKVKLFAHGKILSLTF